MQLIKTYKFEWMVICPKLPTNTGMIDIDAFTYWGAYWSARNKIKSIYDEHGANVIIKRHKIED